VHPSRSGGLHGIQVATRAGSSRGGCPPYLQESKIKSRSLFQVNKISRDVKGLFLGVRSVSSRVELGYSSRTSCMSRWGVVLEESRAYWALVR
jgi:hypothetical protein